MNRSTEQKVLKFIHSFKLIERGDRILTAFSGGPDSVFLLLLLLKFKKKFKIDIAAFHLNHKLRAKNSDEDEKFCKDFCVNNDLSFYSSRKNVKQYAKDHKISVEEAGRIIRYSELKKCAEQNSFNKIATAHILDDNTETVFLNLVKGTGLKGLTGIPVARGNIIRPLLSVSKSEILSYLERNGIDYRIDFSNLSTDYQRNFLRHEIISKIKNRINPSLDSVVMKSSAIMKNYHNYIYEILEPYFDELPDRNEEELKISFNILNQVDKRLQNLFLQEVINRNFDIELNNEKLISLKELQYKQTGKRIDLDKKVIAIRERNEIIIRLKSKPQKISFKFKAGNKIKIGSKYFSIIEKTKQAIKFHNNPETEYVDADNLNQSFELRNWKPGDKFIPLGMKGSKKISDFLTELKALQSERKNALVLTNSGNIVWVVGYRIDDRFKITNKTRKVYRLSFK